MSEMPKAYDPKAVEGEIFASWSEAGYFRQPVVEGEKPFSIVIPPPNVTGSLHMGHALNNTIQDVLIRRFRMMGTPSRWIVGTDHAGIATQNKVEQKLAKEGLDRYDLGREKFVEACWEWKNEYGNTIIQQLKAMGCSCDYEHERFTMDAGYQKAVRRVFVELFDQGLIYRGNRIINWCPRCTTALSDIEVEHEELEGKIWHFRYPLKEPVGGREYIVVATTRPETMLGDTCVAVNPEDDRYRDLVGATVVLPLLDREIPIVADDYVDVNFGTGAVKVTPAHDPNDFEIGERHGCAKINIFDEAAHVTAEGGPYEGLTRLEARDRVIADIEAAGLLEKVEDHCHAVGHCYRCHTVIEPWLSDQWFVDMKPLAAPAIEAVRDGRVSFHPKRWEKVYFDWMENIRDWCISRQLWWGHQIPVFYCEDCDHMQASEEDLTECPKCGGPVRQDPDVLDTWFSSALWPFATLGWPDETPDLAYFYPTSVLSTARDILFLWVARMIMQGLRFPGDVPYSDVIIHPTVFNAEGKRMSKSLGTGVDPLDLMEHYGADGMRFGLMLQVTGSQDVRFSEEKLASSRNFANKIWNASRFVLMNLPERFVAGEPVADRLADRWILSRLARVTTIVDRAMDVDAARAAGAEPYDFGEAARALYEFFWSEFCDWYIEMAKGRLAEGGDAADGVRSNLVFVLDRALRLLHPFMPYVTEAIWRNLPLSPADRAPVQPHATAPSLMVAAWPSTKALGRFEDSSAEAEVALVQEVVTALRAIRARYTVPPRTQVEAVIRAQGEEARILGEQAEYLRSLAGVSSLDIDSAAMKPPRSAVAAVAGVEAYVPLGNLVDVEAERTRVGRELDKARDDLEKLTRKLSNEGFLAKAASEVIDKDRRRAGELAETVETLTGQLAELAE